MLVLLLAAVALQAGFFALLRLRDFQRYAVEFIAVILAMSLFYIVSAWRVSKNDTLPRRPALTLMVLAGLAFRLTLAPLDPTLTEDPYRYRWNAKLQAAGGNPYRERPGDARWEGLRDRTWPLVTGKDLTSPYGPLLEWTYRLTFAVASRLTADEFRQVWLFKLPYAAADLGAAALLVRLGGARALIYLWSPLVVVEFWASGHNDSMLLFFLLLALQLASGGRWIWAFGALWAATLIKFWPALLFPLFLLAAGRQGLWALAWIPTALLVAAPYWGAVSEVQWILQGFLGGWTNNASLFHLIYAAAGRDFEQTRSIMTALVGAATLGIAWRRRPLPDAMLRTITVLLLLSANAFPWYLTWLLPFLVLRPSPALLLWTALAPLAYHVLIGYHALSRWAEDPFFLYLEYLPVYGMLLAAPWLSGRSPPEASASRSAAS